MARFLKVLAITAFIAGAIPFGAAIYLESEYVMTRPKVPKPEQRRVYRLNYHGSVVYLTYEEHHRLQLLYGFAGIAGAVFMGSGYLWNRLDQSKQLPGFTHKGRIPEIFRPDSWRK